MKRAIFLIVLGFTTVVQAQTSRPSEVRGRGKFILVPKEMLEIPRVAPIARPMAMNRYEVIAAQPWMRNARNRHQFLEGCYYGWGGFAWWGWAPYGYPCWW